MQAKYLEEQAYTNLLKRAKDHLDLYANGFADLSDFGLTSEAVSTSSINLDNISLVPLAPNATNAEKNANDATNIKIVYGHWKNLTPWQAHNKYLWTYYCHMLPSAQGYIRSRWELDTVEQVLQRFFVTEKTRQLTRENALSSLWWKGYLSYDEANENNHFWLTERLGGSTNFADYIDTLNSYNPVRRMGFLKGIADALDESGQDTLRNDDLRKLNKYLNHRSVVVPLDFLSEDEMRELCKAKLLEYLAG